MEPHEHISNKICRCFNGNNMRIYPPVLLREAIPPDCGKSNHIQTAPIRKTMAEAIAAAIMSPELFCRH